jgi:hypothetical protein
VGIILLVALGLSTFYVEGLQYSVPIFAVLLLVMSAMYWNVRRSPKFAEASTMEITPESSPVEP